MRVLVIEDCADTAVTMALLLRQYGHGVLVAQNGEEGLDRGARIPA